MTYFLVSLFASLIGAVCGIGGGVIIKPVLNALSPENISTIHFLSGCTVLAMSCYSVGKALLFKDQNLKVSTAAPLALGASLGGILGSRLFSLLKNLFSDTTPLSLLQSGLLAILLLGCFIYTLKKNSIRTLTSPSPLCSIFLSLGLGITNSFLGIGGGPLNLIVLSYFFSMDAKTCAINSLFIIFFSQLASLITSLATASVPGVSPTILLLMVIGGIGGGILGRFFNKKIDNKTVDGLFLCVIVLIMGVCVYNLVWCLF